MPDVIGAVSESRTLWVVRRVVDGFGDASLGDLSALRKARSIFLVFISGGHGFRMIEQHELGLLAHVLVGCHGGACWKPSKERHNVKHGKYVSSHTGKRFRYHVPRSILTCSIGLAAVCVRFAVVYESLVASFTTFVSPRARDETRSSEREEACGLPISRPLTLEAGAMERKAL